MLIESALWNEINIAHTGRKLGINSDARYRFERGVDPAFMLPGLELATKMVIGPVRRRAVRASRSPAAASAEDRIIEFPLDEIKRLAGLDVNFIEVKRVLGHLGFFVAGNPPDVKVAVPSWRADVHGKADIVEEVVRIVGVDRVPLTPFAARRIRAQAGADHDPEPHPQGQARARRARPRRSGDLVVRRQAAGGTVRRRQA